MDATETAQSIPLVGISKAIIKKNAPNALQTLKIMKAEDCIDALGLRPYVKGSKS